jgi:hypothetical protein
MNGSTLRGEVTHNMDYKMPMIIDYGTVRDLTAGTGDRMVNDRNRPVNSFATEFTTGACLVTTAGGGCLDLPPFGN